MKFSAKQLLLIGVPQNKIKFFINEDFDDVEQISIKLKTDSEKPKEVIQGFLISDFIWKNLGWLLPMISNGNSPVKMSRSELKRTMDNKGLELNGRRPTSKDTFDLDTDFPIKQLVWFPNSKEKKTTWI